MKDMSRKESIAKVKKDIDFFDKRTSTVNLPAWEDAVMLQQGEDPKNTVVFVPGTPPFHVIHVDNICFFKDAYRVVSIERKESISQKLYPQDLARDILSLMDYLGIESAHFCGMREGAVATFALAGVAPGRIRTITVSNMGLQMKAKPQSS